jgi:hypothetical protein
MNKSSPYNPSRIRHSTLSYPDTIKYFGFDNYIDPSTGLLRKIPSAKKWSFEARTNTALSSIQEQAWGAYPYLNNRLREMVALFVFSTIMWTNNVELSSIVNDILHHTDATAAIDNTEVAMDFTENFDAIDEKMAYASLYTDVGVPLIDANNQYILRPFLVVYIASSIIDELLTDIDRAVKNTPKIPKSEIGLLVWDRLAGIVQRDALPGLLFQIHMSLTFQNWEALKIRCAKWIEDITQVPLLQDLWLTGRPLLCLEKMGIKTIPYLCTRTRQELLRDPSLGNQSLVSIQQALAYRWLALKAGEPRAVVYQ